MTGRLLYKVPGLMRTEPEPAAAGVSIMDSIHNKILILNPTDKSAMLMEEPPAQGAVPPRNATVPP